MRSLHRLLALVLGALLLQGSMELGALACVLEHGAVPIGAAAAAAHPAAHEASMPSEHQHRTEPAGCTTDEATTPCGQPMAPGHCAGMQHCAAPIAAIDQAGSAIALGEPSDVEAFAAARPRSPASPPDVPPPRA